MQGRGCKDLYSSQRRLRLRDGSTSEGERVRRPRGGRYDSSREDAPIFEVVVGNRGEEGAGFAPGGLLDAYQSVVSGVREVVRWRRAVMSAVSESVLEGGGGPGDPTTTLKKLEKTRRGAVHRLINPLELSPTSPFLSLPPSHPHQVSDFTSSSRHGHSAAILRTAKESFV
jgi:hypothetical protein